ncbi:MAG: hypothetical protein ACYCYI_12215 [Saccharofermentanales bacterium]
MYDRENWEKLFLLYNLELADTFEKVMAGCENENQVNDAEMQEHLHNHVLNNMQAWYNKPAESPDGKTPAEMIDEIGSAEEAIACFKTASFCCDDEIPEYLKIKLGSFGENALAQLLLVAKTPSWEGKYENEEEPAEDILSAAMALRILGEWQISETLDDILTKFTETKAPDELLADAFKTYIASIGDTAVPLLQKYLQEAILCKYELTGPKSDVVISDVAFEYLIIALTIAAQETKSEATFACLRNCFRAMPRKVIGGICLGDYGDPRGIAVLKGYLDRNEGRFDRQEFYEILSSIKRLGGDTSDIKDPFRDFSKH